MRIKKIEVKAMLVIFFNLNEIIRKKLIPEGKDVNGEYYLGFMERLPCRIARIRSQYHAQTI